MTCYGNGVTDIALILACPSILNVHGNVQYIFNTDMIRYATKLGVSVVAREKDKQFREQKNKGKVKVQCMTRLVNYKRQVNCL